MDELDTVSLKIDQKEAIHIYVDTLECYAYVVDAFIVEAEYVHVIDVQFVCLMD